MKDSISVWDIETIKYLTDEYVILKIYISGLVNEKIEIIEIVAEVHLVHNLKVKLLISINILDSEEMNINFHNWSLTINDKEK